MSKSQVEPNESDWLNIGNDIQERIDGTRPYPTGKIARFPTDEELAAWEKVCPGSVGKIRSMVLHEAQHRVYMEGLRWRAERVERLFYLFFLYTLLPLCVVGTIVIVYSFFK